MDQVTKALQLYWLDNDGTYPQDGHERGITRPDKYHLNSISSDLVTKYMTILPTNPPGRAIYYGSGDGIGDTRGTSKYTLRIWNETAGVYCNIHGPGGNSGHWEGGTPVLCRDL